MIPIGVVKDLDGAWLESREKLGGQAGDNAEALPKSQ